MKSFKKLVKLVGRHYVAFLGGLVFAITSFLAINYITEYFSSSESCASCHEMFPAYRSWEMSAHHANRSGVVAECIDCHLPAKDKFFRHTTMKAYTGAKDVLVHFSDGEYDVERMREKVLEDIPDRRCINCHSGLLVVPVSSAGSLAHRASLYFEGGGKFRCVSCHSDLHERQKNIFSNR